MPDDDKPLYDPDRTVLEDLDFSDPEVAMAYLDHPHTQQLHNDLGRLFRNLPASDQQLQIRRYLFDLGGQRAQVEEHLADVDHDAPERPALEQLLAAINKNIEAAQSRMHELG
ncbi:hypothetical protein ACNUDN_11795 [Mycobacterium sp. smrl_JER01]|uniref:hypothetical protein n=1 Tax=Mycobacterium sp. smrl_JER01 TaxID=3402633 RepID=UPI003ABEE920